MCIRDRTLFDPIPIADKATRYKGGGDTRNNDGSANGLGIGEPGAPSNTLTAADRHGVACFAQQAIGEYEESEKASCLKRRDYKDSTDLILWEYIILSLIHILSWKPMEKRGFGWRNLIWSFCGHTAVRRYMEMRTAARSCTVC